MRTLIVAAVVIALAAVIAVVYQGTQNAAPRPLEVVRRSVQACPQVPEPLCANGTDCCG